MAPLALNGSFRAGLKEVEANRCGEEKVRSVERVVIRTVEGGQMTKDLATLIGPDQPWLETMAFMDAIDANLQSALA